MTFEVEVNGRTRRVTIERRNGGFAVDVDGRPHAANVSVSGWPFGAAWSLILDGRSYDIAIDETPGTGALTVYVSGVAVPASVGSGRTSFRRPGRDGSAGSADGPQRVLAPMPGKVVKVLVSAGEEVAARQGLVVVEAMKMENELRSPKAGRVAEVRTAEGTLVEAGAVLVIVE